MLTTLWRRLFASALFVCLSWLVMPAQAEEAALSYEQFFLRHSATMMLIDPETGNILDANNAAAQFYGFDRDALRSMSIQDINQLTREQVDAERQLAKTEHRNFFIFRHKLANGSIRSVEVHSTPVDYDGRKALLSVVHDISADRERQEELWHYKNRLEEMVDSKSAELSSVYHARNQWMLGVVGTLGLSFVVVCFLLLERHTAHKRLQSSEQRLREIIFGTNVGTWERNVQTEEAIYNERWAEIVGYTLAELQPVSTETWRKLTHPEDVEKSEQILAEVLSGVRESYDNEIRMHHKEGRWVWVLDRGRVVEWTKDGKPLRMSGTHTDITRLKKTEEAVRRLAMTDHLTGLSNRAHFSQSLAESIAIADRENRKFALMMLDLDTFKPVNDRHGHPVGDALLQVVASTIKRCTRDGDVVTRIGGDEFAVIISDYAQEKDVLACAERICREVSRPMDIKGNQINIGISIGVSFYPDDADDAKSLITHADQAMYEAKKSGVNVLTYETFRLRAAS
ncbi:diguanylate cyclase domain-containing protein [Roseibium aggregatum]|uniref:diguanylate cyclase domain-containing protein n=1 Tax=Roseibium aggregatum TaxID=187304 RepID=UPI003A97F23E